MEQTKRKQRWFTPLGHISHEEPRIDGDMVMIGTTIEISKANGRISRQD
jgi:hypothetical protein